MNYNFPKCFYKPQSTNAFQLLRLEWRSDKYRQNCLYLSCLILLHCFSCIYQYVITNLSTLKCAYICISNFNKKSMYLEKRKPAVFPAWPILLTSCGTCSPRLITTSLNILYVTFTICLCLLMIFLSPPPFFFVRSVLYGRKTTIKWTWHFSSGFPRLLASSRLK